MNNKPKVSIIMGIYNCEETLSVSIDSIINQTYENWELIMCDDSSTDNTFNIAKKYEEKYPDKIKLIRNNKNLTLAPTLNKCLKIASGKYIARQDADDLSEHNRLERQVEFIENNIDYDLVGTNMISFDDNGKRGINRLKEKPTKNDYLRHGKVFAHATILIKKSVLNDLGGYCEKDYVYQAEDYELWSRFFMKNYKGINLNENLYWVREDIRAFKRRSAKRRMRGIRLNIEIYTKLNAPLYSYKNILKDIVAIFIPTKIFSFYYSKRLSRI